MTSAKVTSDFHDSTDPVSQFNLMDSTIPDFVLKPSWATRLSPIEVTIVAMKQGGLLLGT